MVVLQDLSKLIIFLSLFLLHSLLILGTAEDEDSGGDSKFEVIERR